MVKQRHEHQAGATTNAAEGRSNTAPCSSQQAAAAWAWFEHGGSTCITPSKAQGLIAAKRNAKFNLARTSRFKKEVLSSTVIPHHSPPECSDDGPAIANGHARRRHSFHDNDLAKPTNSYTWRFRSSCRWTLTSPRFSIDEGPEYQDHEDEDREVDDQISSDLLDKFEVDAVCRQLHDHLSSCSGMSSCTPSFTCNAEMPEYYEAQKAHHDHHVQAHIKPRRYFKSSHAHKPLADNDHHQHINDVVHWLLSLRKISTSSRSIFSTAPALCSSIATADSIIDHRNRHHHHPASPKQFRAVAPINQTSKRQQTLHDRSKHRQSTGRHSNHSGELKRNQLSETADERAEFASSPRKSQQKIPSRSLELELIGGAHPSRLHHSDLIHSKLLQPLMSLLHGAPSTEDDGVLKPRTYFHKHHHIYHHHHYHHLHHANHHQASQDAVLLHPPKLHSFHKEEHMMPPAS